MRLLAGPTTLIAVSLSGCAMAQTAASSCFTSRHVVLPDRGKVAPRLTGGQAGRELVDAIWQGDAAQVMQQLRSDPRLATVRVEPDRTLDSQPDGQYGDLLTFAVATCNKAMVGALLDAGVSPNGSEPGSALTLALMSDDPELGEMLLSRGATADPQKLEGGRDVFNNMAAANHVGAVMMLIRHGLDVTWADRFGNTHLFDALDMQTYAIAELLVKAGADLRQTDLKGYTPAHALAKEPMVAMSEADRDARERLIELAKADGRAWPPPRPTRQ